VLRHLAIATTLAVFTAPAIAAPAAMPRYAHIFVIIEENHNFDHIIGARVAANFNRLAKQYSLATNFYAESHPSAPDYIAILGGDTFGVRDDDAPYCRPKSTRAGCENSGDEGYVDHTIAARSLVDQLNERALTWKGYFEDIPSPGSDADRWPSSHAPVAGQPNGLYAVKHNGFMYFKSVQDDPRRAEKLVGFDALERDIAAGALPNYAHIVPNQCNDMHGLRGENVPEDCDKGNDPAMIARADRQLGELVGKILASKQWNGPENNALVITFDEDAGWRLDGHAAGCCGSVAGDPNNPGGGWIPTIVITNHGPRGIVDGAPYNHYSLLRTTEDAFGIAEHLGHAADEAKGVVAMTPLFAAGK